MRRFLGIVVSLVFTVGIVSPLGAACATGAAVKTAALPVHSSQHGEHQDHGLPSSQSSDKAPCSSHDSDCCAIMISCNSIALAQNVAIAPVLQLAGESIQPLALPAPATPALSVEPPPPRA